MSKSYVLKVVRSDMTTRNGFKWGGVGETTVAQDWAPTKECGNGLHGWLNGIGDISCQSISAEPGALWLTLEVDTLDVIDLSGKVKFPRALTLFMGSMIEAAVIVAEKANEQGPVIGITRSGGDRSTVSGGNRSMVSGGDRSTVSGGDDSTVSGGEGSTVSGGDRSMVSGGDSSTVSGGYRSTVSGGYRSTVSGGHLSMVSGGHLSMVSGGDDSTVSGGEGSTVSGGYRSTVSGGEGSTVSGGEGSTVSGGDSSTVSGGYRSTVSGGYLSTVSGGDGSVLQITYYDARKHIATAYVGEKGIKPYTFYRLNSNHEFEEVTQ